MSEINKTFDLSTLTQLRISKGYTQNDISMLTGIPEKHIKDIEKGKEAPSILELIQITQSLGFELKLSIINKFTFESKDILLLKK